MYIYIDKISKKVITYTDIIGISDDVGINYNSLTYMLRKKEYIENENYIIAKISSHIKSKRYSSNFK